jgi:hypothetical protein
MTIDVADLFSMALSVHVIDFFEKLMTTDDETRRNENPSDYNIFIASKTAAFISDLNSRLPTKADIILYIVNNIPTLLTIRERSKDSKLHI